MITGGTGFIGSHITEQLVSEGHEVTILARDPGKVSGFLGRDAIDFVQGTLADDDAIRRALAGKDCAIHVALGWGDSGSEMALADTVPSIKIFQGAIDAGLRQIIYTSSIAVFGDHRSIYTDDTAVRPDRFYGATKAAAEVYLLAFAKENGIRGNVVRPGYTFGGPVVEGASIYTDRKFPDIVEAAARNEPITVEQNAGTQFIWAGDLARVYSAVASTDVDRRLYTSVSANFTTWEEIARMAIDYTNSTSELIVTESSIDPSEGRNDVSAIDDDFGLRFDSTPHLRDHVAYLAERATSPVAG